MRHTANLNLNLIDNADSIDFVEHFNPNFEAIDTAVKGLQDGKAPALHTHDDRYYTEDEMDIKLGLKQDAEDNTFDTNNKTVSGAINELKHNISELNSTLSGKANSSHTHDDRYYTESEMDTKLNNKIDKTGVKTVDGQSILGSGNLLSKTNIVLLWTNSNPSSSSGFPAQTLSLNLSDYSFILISSKRYTDHDNTSKTYSIIPNGDCGYIYSVANAEAVGTRFVDIRTANKIKFSNGGYCGDGGNNTNALRTIPMQIWGIR